METSLNIKREKPASMRIIFILNAFKVLLAFGFYFVFQINDINIGIGPELILYTALGYVITFAAIVASILKRNLWGLRISIIIDFLISIPITAVIGLVISLISFFITFRKTATTYLQ